MSNKNEQGEDSLNTIQQEYVASLNLDSLQDPSKK